tara:strand:- start:1572 stop:2444 length:873 start_codon:yes stop_codon:yes gene_type:complete
MTSAYWITYETHPDVNNRGQGSYQKLASTCRRKGLPKPYVMGAGVPWTGFSSKWRAVYNFCKDKEPNDVIIVTDARDVLCNRDQRGLLINFNRVSDKGKKIVFGPEIGCCVDTMKEFGPNEILAQNGRKIRRAQNTKKWDEDEEYGDELDATGYYNKKWVKMFKNRAPKNARSGVALNAGLAIGTAKKWLETIPQLKIKSDKEDDQTLWSALFKIRPNLVCIDYNTSIFTNTNVWVPTGCFVSWDKSRKSWKNNKTGKFSYIIQTPGAPNDTYKSQAWSCYMEIYNKLKL